MYVLEKKYPIKSKGEFLVIKFLKKSITSILAATMVVSMCNLSCLGNSFAQDKNDLSNSQVKNEMVTSSKTNSSTKTGKTTAVLTVRKGPSTKYSKLGKLSKGTTVKIVSTTSNGWYKIKYKGKYGYVLSKYVRLNSNQSSYKNYVGNWSCTIKNNEGRVAPAQEKYQIKIKSISGNKVTFDYNAYTSSGSVTLGTENKNIKGTIKNGKVTFYYRGYYNIAMKNYSNEKLKGTLYLNNGYVYLTSKDRGVNINYLKLTKAGRVVRK